MSSCDEGMNACPHMQKRVSVISVGWTMKGNLLWTYCIEPFCLGFWQQVQLRKLRVGIGSIFIWQSSAGGG